MKYGIISQEKRHLDGKDGVIYQIILEADNGYQETQEYFVADGKKAEGVLENAVKVFNDGVVKANAEAVKEETEVAVEPEMIEVK